MRTSAEVIVIGAGLAGLAAASSLGTRAITLERDEMPGGLVRTIRCDGGYWFDSLLHVLYLPDADTEQFVCDLLGDMLAPCSTQAWVDTSIGIVRYPFQMHLGGLPPDAIVRCLADLAQVTFRPLVRTPENFEQVLQDTFGAAMCDMFLFPYNRKVWKRELCKLAPSGFQWTITPPKFQDVVRGALDKDQTFLAYNSGAWYPLPPPEAHLRGMEILSVEMARRAADLRVGHSVNKIDTERREVHCKHGATSVILGYERSVCSTIPLPHLIDLIEPPVPIRLRELADRMKWNRVLMAAFCIRGTRPVGRGHWRYYSDESLVFNRLIFMHEFDAHSAPVEGWGLMAEITEPSEWPLRTEDEVLQRCRHDIARAGELSPDCEIVGERIWVIDPAYVVFTAESQEATKEIHAFLREHHIEPIGRYGRWEYSSMGQVIRDGRAWANKL
jgi:protoporphyrinogen oxidase